MGLFDVLIVCRALQYAETTSLAAAMQTAV
jgi:hypothetical protein